MGGAARTLPAGIGPGSTKLIHSTPALLAISARTRPWSPAPTITRRRITVPPPGVDKPPRSRRILLRPSEAQRPGEPYAGATNGRPRGAGDEHIGLRVRYRSGLGV